MLIPVRICAGTIRPGVHPDREKPLDISVRLRNRDARLQASHPREGERRKCLMGAIERQRKKNVEVLIDHVESPRHHSDNLARQRIHLHHPANH